MVIALNSAVLGVYVGGVALTNLTTQANSGSGGLALAKHNTRANSGSGGIALAKHTTRALDGL